MFGIWYYYYEFYNRFVVFCNLFYFILLSVYCRYKFKGSQKYTCYTRTLSTQDYITSSFEPIILPYDYIMSSIDYTLQLRHKYKHIQ